MMHAIHQMNVTPSTDFGSVERGTVSAKALLMSLPTTRGNTPPYTRIDRHKSEATHSIVRFLLRPVVVAP